MYSKNKKIFMSFPCWGNYKNIFQLNNINCIGYDYYDYYKNLIFTFLKSHRNENILFQVSGHNPTGVDPTNEEWDEIYDIIIKNNHYPIFDLAYQGVASGDINKDAYIIRKIYNESNIDFSVCQSLAKNMGLYGTRTGSLIVVSHDNSIREKIESQLKQIVRATYSTPPIYGERIATTILDKNNGYREEWEKEVFNIYLRMTKLRNNLESKLIKNE